MSRSTTPTPLSASSSKYLSPPSQGKNRSSGLRPIVTSPPWAKDEPPSPTEEDEKIPNTGKQPSIRSDAASFRSQNAPLGTATSTSSWKTFVRRNPTSPASNLGLDPQNAEPDLANGAAAGSSNPPSSSRTRRVFDRSLSWLPTPGNPSFGKQRGNMQGLQNDPVPEEDWLLPSPHLQRPPNTLAQAKTPGWDIPWSGLSLEHEHAASEPVSEKMTTKKAKFRHFLLHNTLVPMLFRLINFILTTTALGIAIQIRLLEQEQGLSGALGSSPTLVVIFAPITLVHVLVSLYLEYFGRPLGLWRTSGKLATTLVEVLFICLWAASFALCIDNYFTSVIPCTSAQAVQWYSQLPRPPPVGEETTEDGLCDHQVGLTCLVGLGLVMYCLNLVISLFRIFERVKYHPGENGRSYHP